MLLTEQPIVKLWPSVKNTELTSEAINELQVLLDQFTVVVEDPVGLPPI